MFVGIKRKPSIRRGLNEKEGELVKKQGKIWRECEISLPLTQAPLALWGDESWQHIEKDVYGRFIFYSVNLASSAQKRTAAKRPREDYLQCFLHANRSES